MDFREQVCALGIGEMGPRVMGRGRWVEGAMGGKRGKENEKFYQTDLVCVTGADIYISIM